MSLPALSVAGRSAPLLALLALLELVAHPLLTGATLRSWAFYWLYTAFLVILPGCFAAQAALRARVDWLVWLGLSWTLGHALELLALLLARPLGAPRLFLLWVPLACGLGLLLRHGAVAPSRIVRPLGTGLALLPGLLVGGGLYLAVNLPELSPLPPRLSDPWFHVENARELRDHAPLMDPRLAGEPLVYHMHAYAPAAAASLATGEALVPLQIRYAGMSSVFLLVLSLFNLGRSLGRGSLLAGAASALLLLLPFDAPSWFASALESGTSFQLFGVYLSTTTLAGHVYLAALLLLVHWHLGGAPWRNAAALALLAFAGAGAKAMFGPVVLCGGLGLAALASLAAGRPRGRSAGLALLLLLGVAPAVLPLLVAEGGYAESAALQLGGVASRMPLVTTLTSLGLPSALALALWIPAFAALPILGAVGARRPRRGEDRDAGYATFAWACFAGGGLGAMFWSLSGASSLFFLYYGVAALCGLAGAGLSRLSKARLLPRLAAALLLVWLPLRLAGVPFSGGLAPDEGLTVSIWRRALWWPAIRSPDEGIPDPAALAPLGPRLTLGPDLRQGLAWARRHLPPEAVFAVNVPEASPYGAYAEARSFVTTTRFHPLTHRLGRARAQEHFGTRFAAVEAWLQGRPQAGERLRRAGVTHLFVDRLNAPTPPPVPGARALFERPGFALYELHAPELRPGTDPGRSG